MHRGARRAIAPFVVLSCLLNPEPSPGRGAGDDPVGLPRFPMKEPDEARRAIAVRPGFHVELVAAEPLLRSPVAIDFDEDGRAYVAEFPEYNQQDPAAKKDPRLAGARGCIRRLEDRDGDGIYEASTVFAADVPMATSVACWDGGIYAGSPPDLIYLKDTDGDGRADVRRSVLTGFGRDAAGEGMFNSIRWGLDNRFRIATGNDGGSVRRADGRGPGPISVRGHHVLLDPRTEAFERTGGGGQHGMSLDDWGRAYVCANSDPFHLVMYDSRYLDRNPYLRAPAAAVNVAPAGKFTKLYRLSPTEPWRALRTRMRTQGLYAGSDEGGKPSGFFTGATGVTVYRGDAYPPEYSGNLVVAEVSNNLIHRAIPDSRGVLVTARDAESDREFLASHDCYFRPAQMANAPDGCLWVLDICRELIETTESLPKSITSQMDVSSGVDRGRIWRIAPEGFRTRSPKLGRMTAIELVALLEHPDGWHRDTASRLLYQRQDRSAIPALKRLAAGSSRPIGRAAALSSLAGLGALEAADVLAALDDPDPHVRAHALRLAEPFAAASDRIGDRMTAMAVDPDLMVRYQLAFSLGAIPGERPAAALSELAKRDGSDSWMRLAILSSVSRCTGAVFTRLVADAGFRSSSHGRMMLAALVNQTGAAGRPADLDAILAALDGPLASESALARAIVVAMMDTASPEVRKIDRVGAILEGLLADARATASDEKKPIAARTAAIRGLRLAGPAEAEERLSALLAPSQPSAVQAEAVATLGRFDDPKVASILIVAWPGFSPRLRAAATEVLFSRPAWVGALLDAVEKGTIRRSDLDPARLALLRSYPDQHVRNRAGRLFAAPQARRQDVVASYRKALEIAGEPRRGKEVFKANCSSCHRLEGVGQQVGADIAAIRDRGLETVLLNILDPNREVMPQFLSYVLVTTSGRVLTGIITAETAGSLTIRQPDGREETVLRIEIDQMRSTGLSYMPEGLEKQIDIPAMADLLAYLNALK